VIDRIDSWIGQGVEDAIRRRHRRRLARAGRLEQLDPPQDESSGAQAILSRAKGASARS
jgi:hypothetical protein